MSSLMMMVVLMRMNMLHSYACVKADVSPRTEARFGADSQDPLEAISSIPSEAASMFVQYPSMVRPDKSQYAAATPKIIFEKPRFYDGIFII